MKEPSSHHFLERCMKLAEKGRGSVSPNPVVGAVLVRKGKIIAEDWHRKYEEAHAERNLLQKYKGKILPSDVLYVTLEPCCHHGKTPPCADIILERKVKNVVIGLKDPNPKVNGKGISVLKKAEVKVTVIASEANAGSKLWLGASVSDNMAPRRAWSQQLVASSVSRFAGDLLAMTDQLRWQNRFFFHWIQKKTPWVTLKVAQTLDGRITHDRGQRLQLTGKKAMDHAHHMRRQYDAILVGVKTVIVDNPKFRECRPIILDAALSTPLSSYVLRPGTIIFASNRIRRRKTRKEELQERGVEILMVDSTPEGFLDLHQIVKILGNRGVTSLLVEGGPSIWSSFLRDNLANEFMLYFASKFLENGVNTFENLGFSLKSVQFREAKIMKNDLFWHGTL